MQVKFRSGTAGDAQPCGTICFESFKAIAEQHNVRMPGFFAYMLYSGCLLLPLFAAATVLFFV